MTNKQLGFIKKSYDTINDAKLASIDGKIVFDEKNKVICVGGTVYGEAVPEYLKDAEFKDSVLTITKNDDTEISIDFSDIASAKAVMGVFDELYKKIGLTGSDSGIDYSDTEYLKILGDQTHTPVIEKNLVNADRVLDTAIKDLTQEVIDNEEVIAKAFKAVKNSVGLNDNLEYVAPQDANYINTAESVSNALDILDETLYNRTNLNIKKQTQADTGYFATYILTQNNVQVGEKINIPKDFLVKSASVETVTAEDKAPGGKFADNDDFKVGDKYIDFVVNVKSGTKEQDEHIYLNVKDLVDVYTPEPNAEEVQLAIDANNVISATIVDESIKNKHLNDEVVVIPTTVPEVKVNDDATGYTGKLIATVGDKEIKVKVGLFWDEWEEAGSGSGSGI